MRARDLFSAAFVVAVAANVAFESRAEAQEVEAFARVVAEHAEIRTGPGTSYRSIAAVERGDTIAVDRRGSDQYWLKVVLEDGRSGWMLGDEVEVYAVGGGSSGSDHPSRPGLFAPPPLLGARGGLALFGGVIGARIKDITGASFYSASDGYVEARPALVLAPEISIEPYIGITRTDDGSLTNLGVLATFHLFPDWAIDPYVGAGGGHMWSHANADTFAVANSDVWVARAGGGFLFGLRGRILVRIEATDMVLFTPNGASNMQTYMAGLGVYF